MASEKIFYSSGNDPDVDLWLNQLSIQPTQTFITNLNVFVNTLKSTGIWGELDRLWLFATEQEQHASISLVNPTSTPLSIGVQPTWTANVGYSGNGTSTYLNTNYTATINANKWTLNSASLGIYSRSNMPAATKLSMGAEDAASSGKYMGIALRWTGNSPLFRLNTSNILIGSVTDTRGFFAVQRTSSTAVEIFRNGISLATGSVIVTGLCDTQVAILSQRTGGGASNFDDKQISLAYIGSGNINQTAFYNAIQDFATLRGFNV